MKRLVMTAMVLLSSAAASAQYAPNDGWHGREERVQRWNGEHWGGDRVRSFASPMLGDLPLDICPRVMGIDGVLRGRCGIPVANRFCRAHGFAEAVDAPQTGGRGPTRLLSGEVVTHPWATTFKYITCERDD